MRKRVVALLLTAVMVLSLSACSGSAEADEEQEAAEEKTEAVGEDAEKDTAADQADADTEGEEDTGDEEESKSGSSDTAAAGNWRPTSPVTLVVPYGAGDINDISARVLAQYAEKYVGQIIYLENVVGDAPPASGWTVLQGREGNGLTIGVVDLPAFNNTLIQGLRSYGTSSFKVICNFVTEPAVVVVRKNDNRFRSLDDLAECGRDNQGALVAATTGERGAMHAAIQGFCKSAGFTYTPNHQPDAQSAIAALRGSAADFCVVTVADIVGRDTDLRVLGVFSDQRVAAYPDVPTLGESGYFDQVQGTCRCLVAPAGVSDDMVAFYAEAFRQTMEDSDYLEASEGINTEYRDTDATKSLIWDWQWFLRHLNDAYWTIDVPAEEVPAA